MNTAVRTFSQLAPPEQARAGGKGGTLARLYRAGYPVPDGFVVMPSAFVDDTLTAEAWAEVQAHATRLRKGDAHAAFAVRSSALSEDSAQASFAGEFETMLDVHTDEAIREAIHQVRRSRHGERVSAYSRAQALPSDQEMAVVVQRLVRADMAGVLFTADPVTGSRASFVGNFVHGLGDELVSGEVEPYTFDLKNPTGEYAGPPELKPISRKLYMLGAKLEKEIGCPQDIEWAVADGRLFLLQSRPITTLRGYEPTTGEWNDSFTGDFLWSNANFSEAVPETMTPLTWSVWLIFHSISPVRVPLTVPGAGNIAGRPYVNVSLIVSVFRSLGMSQQDAIRRGQDLFGLVPDEVEVPVLPVSRFTLLRSALPGILKQEWLVRRIRRRLPAFLDATPARCREMRQEIDDVQTPQDLAAYWHDVLHPAFLDGSWMVRTATKLFARPSIGLRRELTDLVGLADANALLSNMAGGADAKGDPGLASLGPVVGLSRVARGEMSRESYLERYGHRGPNECELAVPQPAEDPSLLDQQLADFARSPVDVDALLSRQRLASSAALSRLETHHPGQARTLSRRIDELAAASRLREAARSELTRLFGVIRVFALRAGSLTGLDDGVFFLSVEELLETLAGHDRATAFIPARRETYRRYQTLPPLPAIIRGRFDPFAWAADPNRRTDIFDAHAPAASPASKTLSGFAGAAGRVEGPVRILQSYAEGEQLRPAEVLVAPTTNIGWTPLFPRAAAIVTDVGAPLSHAAIIARELGIPAVVGCGNATMRLRTGDRVRVDGGRGVVEILEQAG
jgi:phosphohistidine swiveling domain-containing protein